MGQSSWKSIFFPLLKVSTTARWTNITCSSHNSATMIECRTVGRKHVARSAWHKPAVLLLRLNKPFCFGMHEKLIPRSITSQFPWRAASEKTSSFVIVMHISSMPNKAVGNNWLIKSSTRLTPCFVAWSSSHCYKWAIQLEFFISLGLRIKAPPSWLRVFMEKTRGLAKRQYASWGPTRFSRLSKAKWIWLKHWILLLYCN
jgi:hypothetical protein